MTTETVTTETTEAKYRPTAAAAVVVALLLGLLGWSNAATAAAQPLSAAQPSAALDAAEARWAAAGLTSYQISYTERPLDTGACSCPSDVPALYTVVDGVVTDVSTPVDMPYGDPVSRTVDDMFAAIRDATNNGATVDAVYDQLLGYPLEYS